MNMDKKLYHILPVFNYRIWGGQELSKRYGYQSDLPNIGECYNVIAMKGHLDCDVEETNEKLSDFFHTHYDLFQSDTPEMPVRAAMANTVTPMSVQVHPDDAYALSHDNRLGKPDGVYFIDGESSMELGHHAASKEQFKDMVERCDWDHLLRYIPVKKGEFVDVPYGTLHAFGKNIVLIEFSQNADLTYRLYDYDRLEPDGSPRQLHVQKVLECVNVPDDTIQLVDLHPYTANGCTVTVFHSEPGVYSAGKIQVEKDGIYEREEFYFLTVIEGDGVIQDMKVHAGETIFVPCAYGPLSLKGAMELTYVTYEKPKR